MKTIITLFNKVFGSKKQIEQIEQTELTEEQLDAWIVSIRQKPQLSNWKTTASVRSTKSNNNGLEEAGNLVLA